MRREGDRRLVFVNREPGSEHEGTQTPGVGEATPVAWFRAPVRVPAQANASVWKAALPDTGRDIGRMQEVVV